MNTLNHYVQCQLEIHSILINSFLATDLNIPKNTVIIIFKKYW